MRYSPLIFGIVLTSLGLAFISVNNHVSKMVFEGNEDTREDSLMVTISLITSLVPLLLGIFLLWWLL